jgi:hypothetical protein
MLEKARGADLSYAEAAALWMAPCRVVYVLMN